MTRAEKLAYARGYAAARTGKWPDHKPPTPPDPLVAALLAALRGLRDAADAVLSTVDADDPFEKALGPHIDAADEAMRKVSLWLKEAEE